MQFNSGDENQTMSEINVTPFVDVLLVLLIIFMISVPLAQTGISVNLPSSKSDALKPKEDVIVLTITKDQKYYINKQLFAHDKLREKIEAIYKNRQDRSIYIRADKDVIYDSVVQAVDIAKQAGVLKVGMVTVEKKP